MLSNVIKLSILGISERDQRMQHVRNCMQLIPVQIPATIHSWTSELHQEWFLSIEPGVSPEWALLGVVPSPLPQKKDHWHRNWGQISDRALCEVLLSIPGGKMFFFLNRNTVQRTKTCWVHSPPLHIVLSMVEEYPLITVFGGSGRNDRWRWIGRFDKRVGRAYSFKSEEDCLVHL